MVSFKPIWLRNTTTECRTLFGSWVIPNFCSKGKVCEEWYFLRQSGVRKWNIKRYIQAYDQWEKRPGCTDAHLGMDGQPSAIDYCFCWKPGCPDYGNLWNRLGHENMWEAYGVPKFCLWKGWSVRMGKRSFVTLDLQTFTLRISMYKHPGVDWE